MTQGLEVWDKDKTKMLAVTTSLCRVLGKVDMTKASGVVTCDCERPWAYTYRISSGGSYPVKIIVGNNVISWEYLQDAISGSSTKYEFGMRLVYGSY